MIGYKYSVLFIIIAQLILEIKLNTGWEAWILGKDRNVHNFFDANWEGIVSIPVFLLIQYSAMVIR